MLPVLFVLENGANVRGNVYPGIALPELKTLAYLVTRPFSPAGSMVVTITTPFLRSDGVADEASHRGLAVETDVEVTHLLDAAAARGEPPRFGVLQQPFSHPHHVDTTSLEHAFRMGWISVLAFLLPASSQEGGSALTAHVVQKAFEGAPSVKVLEFLLERGLDMNAWTLKRHSGAGVIEVSLLTLVVEAYARSNYPPPARFMLERGADPNLPRGASYTSLKAAIDFDSDALARLLLEHGAEGANGALLHIATEKANVALVRTLLAAGADPNAVSNGNAQQFSQTALDQAMSTRDRVKRLELVKVLLEAGASTSVAGPVMGRRPLHTAADGNDEELVRLLLEHDADVNAKMQDGRTALRMLREKVYGGNAGRDNFGRGHHHPPLTPEAEAVVKRIIKMLEAKGASD
jgi:hypothetical protein